MQCPLAAACFLAVTLAPAQTYIVDQANGLGTNFTTLVAAVAAVPDGAVLLVRPGAYAGFSVTAKGLAVLADPGVTITSDVVIGNTGPQQATLLRGLIWTSSSVASNPAFLNLSGCQGAVVVEVLATPTPNLACVGSPSCPRAVHATACAQLMFRSCTLGGATLLDGCVAVFEGCTLQDHDCVFCSAFGGLGPTQALRAVGSSVQIAGSNVLGGDGSSYMPGGVPNGTGIELVGADLRLVRSSVTSGLGPPQWGGVGVSGAASTLRVDPTTTVRAVSVPFLNLTVLQTPMPSLSATSGAPGGTIDATTSTEFGDVVVLAVGLRGAPVTVPGFTDSFWLDPSACWFHSIGVQQPTLPVRGSIAVPNAANLRGMLVVWHAVCFGPATGSQNSNPAISVIR